MTQVTQISGAVYTVTIGGITGNGTLGLNLVDNGSIHDLAGDPLTQPNAPASFQNKQNYSTGQKPIAASVGDLTDDGKTDIVVANFGGNSVSVLLGNGNGTFQQQHTFATGASPVSTALGDLTGDGKTDIVVANEYGHSVSVLLGNGNGTFQAQQTFATGSEPISVVLDDLTGDGKTDIVVANANSGTVSVLLANGNGTFQAQQTFPASNTPESVAVADVNGDGIPDIVVPGFETSTVNVLLGNGNGTFQTPKTFAVGDGPLASVVGDVNGDGLPDLIVANDLNNTVSVLLGNGSGTFQTQQTFFAPNASSVTVSDVNGDGKPDLIVAGQDSVSVLLGNGNGTFQAAQGFSGGLSYSISNSLAVGDVNGDGRPDLIVPNSGSNTVSILLNTVNGNFTGQVYTIDSLAPSVQAINRATPLGPVTNANSVSYTVTFSEPVTGVNLADFQAAATGTLATGFIQLTPVNAAVYTLSISGITGNGTLGLNLVNNGTIHDSIGLLSLSNASFLGQVYTIETVPPFVQSINRTTPLGPITNATTVNYTVTFSDSVTGVNATDFQLAFGGTAGATITQVTPVSGAVYIVTVSAITGNGTLGLNLVDNGSITDLAGDRLTQQHAPAAFQAQQTFATGLQPYAVALGDVTGDGNTDLVVPNANNDTVSVLVGNGNGTFQAQQIFGAGIEPKSVALGDVNGDGKPDIVVANDYGPQGAVSVLLGNGNGTFQSEKTFDTGSYPISVALGQLAGDGKTDIVVANSASGNVSVLLGNGNGTFQTQQTFATGSGPMSVAVGDVTGDGKADIVVANLDSTTVSVLLGNGNGTFQAQRTFATGFAPISVAIGDVNGDGIPDIVVANEGSNTVSVLLGNGNGTFQAQQTFGTGIEPFSVAFGDVTGDGITDLVVANNGSSTVSVLLGNGNGTFQAQQTFATGIGPLSAAVGDLTSDGRPDLVVADGDSNTVSVLLNATNGNFTGQAYTIISPGVAAQFVVSAVPTSISAGSPATLTVTAQDQSSETSYGYTGTVHFSTTDAGSGVLLPSDYTFVPADNGVHVFTSAVTLVTLGSQTVTVTDTTTATITGNAVITVNPVDLAFVGLPTSVKAGTAFLLEVVAENQAGDTDTSFAGVVHFSSTDPQAQVPADTTLTGGIGVFAVELRTAGDHIFTAAASNGNGTSAVIFVSPIAADRLAVSVPAGAETGIPAAFTVTALDPYGNVAPSYAGTIHFTSSDSGAALPPNSTLTGGVGVFSATLETSGSTTITATDTAGTLSAVSAPIAVRGLIVTGLSPTPTGFNVTFAKAFDPTTLSLYSAPDDVLLVNGSGQVVRGSLVLNSAAGAPPDTSFTFVATSGVLAAGTYTVTLVSGPSGIKDASGVELDGTDSGIPGNNYVTTFTVAATPSVVLSIPDFARGPDSAANILLPNATGSGIPITLTGAANLTAATFNLTSNPALLSISGTLNGPSGTFTLLSNTGGVASFAFQSGTPLNGTITLGYLLAQVPNSAASSYKSKALLHLGNIVINGSSTAANGDGIEAVAYLGDVAGTGSFSPLDAALISQVAVGIESGFSAFPQLDPSIIGDISGTGNTTSTDVTLMNRLLAGIATPQIPQPPAGLIIPPTGPDPTLSLPPVLTANSGGTVTVPVNIDTARPAGSSGLMEATLALCYNPQLFSVTTADIKLGTVPNGGSGWQLGVAINPETGEIGISLCSTTAIQSAAGGSLVTITLHVKAALAVGQAGISLVDEVNPTGLRAYQTGLTDGQGALVVHATMADDQTMMAGVQIGLGEAAGSSYAGLPKPEAATDLLTTARDPSQIDFGPAVEQIFADAGGMGADQSGFMPQPAPSCLPAEDWAVLLDDMGIDQAAVQGSEMKSLLALVQTPSRQTGQIWADDDPDIDV